MMKKLETYFIKKGFTLRYTLWLATAFVSFFVPPLGLIALLLLRRAEEKKHPVGDYTMRGIGFFLMIFSGVETVMTLCFIGSGGASVLIVAAWFLAGALLGLWMYQMGKSLERSDTLHRVLMQVIFVSHITRADRFAEVMNMRRDRIDRELGRMVRWGVLKDAQYDAAQGKLLLPKEKWAEARVICKECGAQLVINIGETLVCPYCKTAL